MSAHRTGCLICGRELRYFDQPRKLRCEKCGGEFESTAACEDNHFVCDKCHARAGYEAISDLAGRARSTNPIEIAAEMMNSPFVNMHGPEHHYLVAAALLAAFAKAGGDVDLAKALPLARQRAEKVPGGVCGFWGCCGAGVGTGIFVSLITGATPLSAEPWQLANRMTSQSLAAIADNGGPRCCKRDSYLAILTAVDFVRDHLGVAMEKPGSVSCAFYPNNPSCKKAACLFWPE